MKDLSEKEVKKLTNYFLGYEWHTLHGEYELYRDLIKCFFEEREVDDEIELDLDELCAYIERKIAVCTNEQRGWYAEKSVSRRDLFQALSFFRNCQYRRRKQNSVSLREMMCCGEPVVLCEKCGGLYRYAGITYSIDPPRYLHECDCCDMCDDLAIFTKKYK